MRQLRHIKNAQCGQFNSRRLSVVLAPHPSPLPMGEGASFLTKTPPSEPACCGQGGRAARLGNRGDSSPPSWIGSTEELTPPGDGRARVVAALARPRSPCPIHLEVVAYEALPAALCRGNGCGTSSASGCQDGQADDEVNWSWRRAFLRASSRRSMFHKCHDPLTNSGADASGRSVRRRRPVRQ